METNVISKSLDNILTHLDECIAILDESPYSQLILQLALDKKLRKGDRFYGMGRCYCGSD